MATLKLNLFVVVFFVGLSNCWVSVAQEGKIASVDQTCEKCLDGECKCKEVGRDTTNVANAKGENSKRSTSTHVQTGTFSPKVDGKNVQLATFRVRPDGNIVACVSPLSSRRQQQHAGYIQIYSPELKLVSEYGLPFAPTAIDVDHNGNMFVGGAGRLAKLSENGEVIAECESLGVIGVDLDELRRAYKQEILELRGGIKKGIEKQIKKIEEQIARLNEKAEQPDEELSKTDRGKLRRLEKTLQINYSHLEQVSEVKEKQLEERLRAASRTTGITVTRDDLYVAKSAHVGYCYEVYRFNHRFEDMEKILEGLRGCCGQMDIHALGEHVAIAENTKFNVAIYDRDGEEVNRIGGRFKGGSDSGFVGCCNPMNVLCCDNGDYLVAESSVGKIKRFNAAGELVGYVGKAKIGGGCKHVAFGHDAERDRYYVQHEDLNEICILNVRTFEDADSEEGQTQR